MNRIRTETSFESHFGLSRLPWFELADDGRLRLTAELGYPIIDMHTHLAMTYFARPAFERWPDQPVYHYLPLDAGLDLDVYANRNLSAAHLRVVKQDLVLGSLTNGRAYRRSHTPKNLLREMDEMGIGYSAILPIDLPFFSYNAESYLEVARTHPRLLGFGSVHPRHKNPGAELDQQKCLGARAIKLHPAMQLFRADSSRAMRIYGLCGELGLPVFFHAGPAGINTGIGESLTQMKHLWPGIVAYPDTTFVLGHSGALQMEMALDLAQHHDNCWLELSSQSLSNVGRILDEGPGDRIVSGSDWAFYHQALPIAKVMSLTEQRPALRKAVLYENAARLMSLPSS